MEGSGGMAKVQRVYWDSCAWLGLLNRESERIQELELIWYKAERGEIEIWTSTISQMEVCKLASERDALKIQGNKAKGEILTNENLALIENVFDQPFVKRVPLDVEISSRARRAYREIPGLNKVPDAAHVVSAMKWNIPIIHTYDDRDLLHLSSKLKTDDGTELKICIPDEKPAPDLLTGLEDENERKKPD